jgi:probable HAF family extracellular repeat protein
MTIPNAPGATVSGIDPSGGALVGYYAVSSSAFAGFVYQSKALQTLQFPGSNDTFASGINSAGEVVGTFDDAMGSHGFTWTPSALSHKF